MTIDNGIRFVLKPTDIGYPFMQFSTKGNTKQFFLPAGQDTDYAPVVTINVGRFT
jgi:hypothetical protein